VTTPDDVVQRVLSYVDHQAAKSAEELRQLIDRTVAEFDGRLAGVSEEQARFRPAADEWSIVDVLGHLSDATAWTARVAAGLARGQTTAPSGGVSPEPERATPSFAALRQRMSGAWDAVRQAIDGMPADADLSATFAHFMFGAFNCKQWLAFARVHALDHAQQVDAIKAHPRYPSA
jgi:hypothetical protein